MWETLRGRAYVRDTSVLFYVASYHRRSHVSVADAFTKIRVAEPYILISNLSLC